MEVTVLGGKVENTAVKCVALFPLRQQKHAYLQGKGKKGVNSWMLLSSDHAECCKLAWSDDQIPACVGFFCKIFFSADDF